MNDALSLNGKTAIVTGAAQGIGRAIATRFSRCGARVVIADIDETLGIAAATELGEGVLFEHCDISQAGSVESLVDRVVARFDQIDILVNNAGHHPSDPRQRVPIDKFSPDLWRSKIDVDLHGTFYCNRVISAHMVQHSSGCIINIASVAGVVALRNQIAHDAAKAGIIKMAEAMALELGPHGIRVNTISPGSTVTSATENLFYGPNGIATDKAEQMLSFIPLGRPGMPDDIAGAALFLASNLANYVTGHNLVVDGGWVAGFNRNF
ncbi:MAG: short-chain dehydrogenase [Planctomycetaceae bacterium]|jgi:NAD(P)-dependent dehydrogenase (short-subunit alcohol dehydrogenase family)|nr:short-chain dehydrogenase [Planctomycetaceae bacterium]